MKAINNVEVPVGFEVIRNSEFAATFPFENEGDFIQGILEEIKSVVVTQKDRKTGKVEEKTQRLAIIKTDDGVFSVWESVQLEGLFDENPVGSEVYIRFDGRKILKGKNAMKLFTVAVKRASTNGSGKKLSKKPF